MSYVILKLEDVDFNGLTIYVKCGKGKDRTTYFTPVARKYLKKYLNDNNTNQSMCLQITMEINIRLVGIRHITTDLTERCQIHIHPHRFRGHWLRTWLKKVCQFRKDSKSCLDIQVSRQRESISKYGRRKSRHLIGNMLHKPMALSQEGAF